MCGCGGGGSSVKQAPQEARRVASAAAFGGEVEAPGQPQPGDVLVTVTFTEGSPPVKSKRQYPYMLKGQQWWVAVQDVKDHPNWFRVVKQQPELVPA